MNASEGIDTCEATPQGVPVVFDNCDGTMIDPVLDEIVDEDLTVTNTFPLMGTGAFTVSYTATDMANNSASCVHVVSVVDITVSERLFAGSLDHHQSNVISFSPNFFST